VLQFAPPTPTSTVPGTVDGPQIVKDEGAAVTTILNCCVAVCGGVLESAN
jgi:hypothetical protein